ncbi:MAG: DUF455 family protein [Opitutaceae bacterium]
MIQLQEFAKQVLFGTTIEEKLSFPREAIIDTRPGAPIVTPRELSRPKQLKLRDDGVRANHPSIAKLVDEHERGRLLHFFGNHELLATELMALVLLKFPDAPASFRRGVLETLKEEQIHTRMYMNRMQQCGVEFGELPLSDYFWKSVSSMNDPLDYVTRLSLTFEQANLDYSREYAKIFDDVGDKATAKILDKIYRDEIDHVGFGLKWFRKWKANGKTDWEAYRERLSFPLSPARAKGNYFNDAGRVEAGLDAEFIGDLKLFQQSKGRTPSVYWFNPQAEQSACDNSGGQSSTLQTDLAYLPAYLSRQDDLLIMAEPPSQSFLGKLQNYGFHLPEVLVSKPDRAPKIERKLNDLRPWAWSPDSIAFLQDNLDAAQTWTPEKRALFSKTHWAYWAKEHNAALDWLAPQETYGSVATNIEGVVKLRERYRAQGYSNMVCKAPFATAANGNRCIREDDSINPTLKHWIHTILEQQGELLIEPWLNRTFDFSVQFERRNGETKPVAFTRMINNSRGQFRGIITNGFCKGLDPQLTRFLMERVEGRPRIYHYYETILTPKLEAQLSTTQFEGPFGVDAFVYKDNEGTLKLKPVVELNPRYTMGRVSHELSAHNASSSVGFFEIITKSQLKKTSHRTFSDFCSSLESAHPINLTKDSKQSIAKGSFPLTDPETAKQFLALYHVREHIDQLPF